LIKAASALKKIRLLLIPHGDRSKKAVKARSPKTTIGQPIIKNEHAKITWRGA
jgi:hypothetical protein